MFWLDWPCSRVPRTGSSWTDPAHGFLEHVLAGLALLMGSHSSPDKNKPLQTKEAELGFRKNVCLNLYFYDS